MNNKTDVRILKSLTQGTVKKQLDEKYKLLLCENHSQPKFSTKQNSDVMIGGVDMRNGAMKSMSDTTRHLLDDRSSIHYDKDSMNDT